MFLFEYYNYHYFKIRIEYSYYKAYRISDLNAFKMVKSYFISNHL
jgi:hypothetical protein